MAAKKFTQNVMGLEITEDFIYVSLLEMEEDVIHLKKVKSIAIPPRSLMDGKLADPEMVADQVSKALKEDEFEFENIIASINDNRFIKKLDLIPHNPAEDILMELEMRVSKNHTFQQSDFQLGYQVFRESEEAPEGTSLIKQAVLFAAMKSDTIDNLNEFIGELGSQLVSIDLIPLSALRTMLWDVEFEEEVIIYSFVDQNYMDLNFIYKGEVIFSHVLKKDMHEIIEEEYLLEAYINRYFQCVVQSTNLFPNLAKPSKIIYCSRIPHIQLFFEKLKELLGIEIEEYKLSSNIKPFLEDFPEEKLNSYSQVYLPSIGLALKYFEKYGKTLSITKVKKKLAPIVNIKALAINGVVLLAILVGFYFWNNYVTQLKNDVTTEINLVKRQLKVLQSGAFLGQKKQINTLQTSIDFLSDFEDVSTSKYEFYYNFIQNLPNDIIFNTIKLSKQNLNFKIQASGTARYQDSIYSFYNYLDSEYTKVDLSGIKTIYDRNNTEKQTFNVNFTWVP